MKYLHRLREEVIHNSNLRSLPNGTDKTDKRGVEGTSVSFGSAESEDIQISTVDNFTGSPTDPKIYTPALSELPKLTEAEGVDLTALLTEACQDVEGIDAATFRALLSPVDVEDIEGGSIPMVTLNAYARSFAEGIRCGRTTVLAAAIPKTTLPLHVRCGECRHFERDTIDDGSGIGRCKIGGEGTGSRYPALWPGVSRECKDFESRKASHEQPQKPETLPGTEEKRGLPARGSSVIERGLRQAVDTYKTIGDLERDS